MRGSNSMARSLADEIELSIDTWCERHIESQPRVAEASPPPGPSSRVTPGRPSTSTPVATPAPQSGSEEPGEARSGVAPPSPAVPPTQPAGGTPLGGTPLPPSLQRAARTPHVSHVPPRPFVFARAPPPRAPPPPPRFGYRGGGQSSEMANLLESAALAHAARLMAQQRVAGSARAGLPPRPPPRPTPGLPPQLPAGVPPRLPPRLAPGLGPDSPFVFL
jgi:hypothetical protein